MDIRALAPQLHHKDLLGEGAYGGVYRIRLDDVPYELCLKLMRTAHALDCTLHEANALAVTKHVKGVPRLVAVCLDPPAIIMTMHGTETLVTLCRHLPVEEAVLLRIMHSVAGTLASIHYLGLSHNDVKADNVTLYGGRKASTIKVAMVDLGLLTRHGEYPFGLVPRRDGKPFYAPELMRAEQPTSEATDMYSFGYMLRCILPLLNESREIITKLARRALAKPSKRPTFLQARHVIWKAAYALHAWPSQVSQ